VRACVWRSIAQPQPILKKEDHATARISGVTPPASTLTITERQIGDVTVLALSGQITLDDGDLLFRREVHRLLEQRRVKILLDLAGVTHIDSAGVGMLVAKLKTVRERHGDIRLLNMTARSSRLLGMMKILTVFDSFDDEATAVKSFDFNLWA